MSGTGGTGRNLAFSSSNWPWIFSFTTPDKRKSETQTGKNASGAQALMRHHRVVENMKFMRSIDSPVARKDNGITVEIMLRIMFCYAKSVYLYHFIGADGYNDEYLRSISMFRDIGTRAVELLGEDSELSDEVAECHAGAISFRLE